MRQAGRQACRHAGWQTGIQAGRQAGTQVGRAGPSGRQATQSSFWQIVAAKSMVPRSAFGSLGSLGEHLHGANILFGRQLSKIYCFKKRRRGAGGSNVISANILNAINDFELGNSSGAGRGSPAVEKHAARQAGRQASRQVGKQAGRQAYRHSGRQAGRQVGRAGPSGKQAGQGRAGPWIPGCGGSEEKEEELSIYLLTTKLLRD